jgi:hypothetical protein
LAEDHQAVEDAPPRPSTRRRVDAQGASGEVRALGQQPADRRQRLGSIERQKRHRRFRPHNKGHTGSTIHRAAARLYRKLQMIAENARLVLRPPFLPLRHARLHDPNTNAGIGGQIFAREPVSTCRGQHTNGGSRCKNSQASPPPTVRP